MYHRKAGSPASGQGRSQGNTPNHLQLLFLWRQLHLRSSSGLEPSREIPLEKGPGDCWGSRGNK